MAVTEGQIWQDWDSRVRNGVNPRTVRVVTVGHTHAVVENQITGRRTTVALKRFRPSSNGYRLCGAEVRR